MNGRHINQATIDLIKRFEGFRAEAYKCPAGRWTIGYGHTSSAGPPRVRPGMRVTRREAEAILRRDVKTFAARVAEAIGPEALALLNDNQFGALVSFAYNVGLGNFRRSSVLRRVKSEKLDEVPDRLMLWTKARGKRLKGLVRRRRAEGRLFMTPVAEERPPAPPSSGPRPKPPPTPKLSRHQPARKKRGGFFIVLSAVIAALGALLAASWNLLKELFSWPF